MTPELHSAAIAHCAMFGMEMCDLDATDWEIISADVDFGKGE